MPYYPPLRSRFNDDDLTRASKLRACVNLQKLKESLEVIPRRKVDGSLLVATWNLREFGAQKMGPRLIEALFYIAEIIDRFDLVALQEVRRDLQEFKILREILGKWWKALFTNVTEGRPGNEERTAFLYDSRKVEFGGLTGQIVLPPIREGKTYPPADQIARTPFMVGFQAGWFKFTICTAHLYYGTSKADDPKRLREMKELAAALATEVKRPEAWARNMILLGDFNIFSTVDKQFTALKESGFRVPSALFDQKTNVGRNRPYDQIAFIAPSLADKLDEARSGIFPFFDYVFVDNDEQVYAKHFNKQKSAEAISRYYRQWRTFQMSDHNPLWVELRTDFGHSYLSRLARQTQRPPQLKAAKPNDK
jgi:endonuclease/exonuclease/phosphatase family metal-dependent hydrolase